ncbi:MAG: hypothetical protein RDU76_01865 [Candidatus Edwardsbacteria bacterium]|nr:hypothetical protein [Candidatus Edwardsbacteria bacterium]
MKKYYFNILLIGYCIFNSHSFADILPVTTQIGNVIMPATEEVPVEMEKEIVNISDHQVECKFWMKNTLNKNVRMLVAFPGEIGGYELMINGNKTTASTHRAKYKKKNEYTKYQILDSLPFNEFKTWYVDWKPKETVLIEFNYTINGMAYRPGIVEVESLSYVVKTGALWKGPIGKADIYVDLSNEYFKERLKHTKLVASPQNYELKNDTISWHFKNWEPTEDMSVNFCRWLGLSVVKKYNIDVYIDDVQNQKTIQRYFPEKNTDYRDSIIKDYICGDATYIVNCLPEWEYLTENKKYQIYTANHPTLSKGYYFEGTEVRSLWVYNFKTNKKQKVADLDSLKNLCGYVVSEKYVFIINSYKHRLIIRRLDAKTDKMIDSIVLFYPKIEYCNKCFFDKACNKIYLCGIDVVEIDLNNKKVISFNEKGIRNLGFINHVSNGYMYAKNHDRFLKINLNTYAVEKTLECISDFKPWYVNEDFRKLLYMEPHLSRIHVIDMNSLIHEGSFYVEKPRQIWEVKDYGTTAYVLCYRKTEKDFHAVAVVNLKEAMRHLEKTEFYKQSHW